MFCRESGKLGTKSERHHVYSPITYKAIKAHHMSCEYYLIGLFPENLALAINSRSSVGIIHAWIMQPVNPESVGEMKQDSEQCTLMQRKRRYNDDSGVQSDSETCRTPKKRKATFPITSSVKETAHLKLATAPGSSEEHAFSRCITFGLSDKMTVNEYSHVMSSPTSSEVS
jgi:hypothetical protein